MKTYIGFLLNVIVTLAIFFSASAQHLVLREKFKHPLDSSLWQVEIESAPGSFVKAGGGRLILQTNAGVTVWLKVKLYQNIRISYDRVIVDQGGPQDRLSDLNQFWMATDPAKSGLGARDGQLDSYNSLQLYYVGMGGNSNTTTRFRKYDGKGNRALLGEYSDSTHLLKPNQKYHIDLVVENGEVSFWVNHLKYFSFKDPEVLQQGYFGFRSTKSHQEISALEIYQLP